MRLRRAVIVLLAASLVSSACDEIDSGLEEVKREHKIDLRNPTDVARAAAGADAIGNQEAEDGLDVVKGFRRATHEANGDRARANGDHRKAVEEYKEALRWTEETTVDIPFVGPTKRERSEEYKKSIERKRGRLHERIAETFGETAADQSKRGAPTNDPGLESASQRNYMVSAQSYVSAADADPARRIYFIRMAAWSYRNAGADLQACELDRVRQSLGSQSLGYCPGR